MYESGPQFTSTGEFVKFLSATIFLMYLPILDFSVRLNVFTTEQLGNILSLNVVETSSTKSMLYNSSNTQTIPDPLIISYDAYSLLPVNTDPEFINIGSPDPVFP